MKTLDIDWQGIFLTDIAIVESIIRGTLLYFIVFIVMRSTLRRTAGELAMLDFIFVLLVANGAADSMVGGSISVVNGFVLILTIVGWNYLLNTFAWHVPIIQRWTTPPPLQLIEDGEMLRANMRKEFITRDELLAQLREEGIEEISSVRSAFLEVDGNISVIPYS